VSSQRFFAAEEDGMITDKQEHMSRKWRLSVRLITIMAIVMFFYHLLGPTANLPVPPISALYWFLLFVALLILPHMIPYIREITFKDFTILFQEIRATRQMLQEAKNELMEARLRFDKTREELVWGYFEYLKGLPEKERMTKKIGLTKRYLENMAISEAELTQLLNKIPGVRCPSAEEITPETLQAVMRFQEDFNLIPDGVFGYQTYARLLELTRGV
jgi:hypothetical protein